MPSCGRQGARLATFLAHELASLLVLLDDPVGRIAGVGVNAKGSPLLLDLGDLAVVPEDHEPREAFLEEFKPAIANLEAKAHQGAPRVGAVIGEQGREGPEEVVGVLGVHGSDWKRLKPAGRV
jgi:hypothetical protein